MVPILDFLMLGLLVSILFHIAAMQVRIVLMVYVTQPWFYPTKNCVIKLLSTSKFEKDVKVGKFLRRQLHMLIGELSSPLI